MTIAFPKVFQKRRRWKVAPILSAGSIDDYEWDTRPILDSNNTRRLDNNANL